MVIQFEGAYRYLHLLIIFIDNKRVNLMNKIVLYGLIFSISSMSGQFAIADINSVNSEEEKADVTNDAKINNPSWMGVWIDKLPIVLSKHLSSTLKKGQGLIIRKVASDSPAKKTGLLPYDIISTINDKDIYSEQQLVGIVSTTKPGKKINLDIIRQGKLLSLEVTVEVSPNQKLSHSSPSRFHQGMGTVPLTPPDWMNDPFFRQGFDQSFFNQQFNQQFNRMQQQLNQLHQQHQSLHLNQQQQFQLQNSRSQFESIQIESKGDKQRAIVKYEDSEGNKKEFVFEGDKNEVRQQIQAQSEMDEDKKHSLLQALDMNNNKPLPFDQKGYMRPDWFQFNH